MNGKIAKLLRRYSKQGTGSAPNNPVYTENKRRWNRTPRTLRNVLRRGAKDQLAER